MSINDSPFWDLVQSEHQRARAYCTRLTGNAEEGDDLYQDVIIKAYRAFGELRNVDAFRSWLYKIINNGFKARFRNPWWKRIVPEAFDSDKHDWSSDPSPWYDARRRLEQALAVLSSDDRIIVTLAELEGWKIAEIAGLFEKSEGLIKMRLSRARAKMRGHLSKSLQGAIEPIDNEESESICCVTKPEKD